MYYSGTNTVVKLLGGPYVTPVISSTFTFPITKLQVTIDQGKLTYMTADGTDVYGIHGFCVHNTSGAIATEAKTRDECDQLKHNMNSVTSSTSTGGVTKSGTRNGVPVYNAGVVSITGHPSYSWVPFIQASTATTLQEVQLSHHQLATALDQMAEYYENAYVQLTDFNALQDWIVEIKDKISRNQATHTYTAVPGAYNPRTKLSSGYDIDTARILDAIAINFSAEQSSIPLYNPGSQFMATQMRGNVMVQGSVTINYDSSQVMDLINHNGPMNLEVHYFDNSFEKDEFLLNPEYIFESEARAYTIHDVRFISKQHATNPSPENIVENIGFIAKTLTWTSI